MPDTHDDNEPVGRLPKGDNSTNRRNLSEISHLFLSDLRKLNGNTPPTRRPPGQHAADDFRGDQTIDLTADEFDGETDAAAPTVRAVIAAHPDDAIRHAADYAAGVGGGESVGLVIVGANGVRLACVAADFDGDYSGPMPLSDPLRFGAALKEMRSDVHRWLVVLPEPRLPQARRLLANVADWTLLTGGDHDGVVAGYRALKGVSDLKMVRRPTVTLALHDAPDAEAARRHANKLVGVCGQFLDLKIIPPADADGAVYEVAGDSNYRELVVAEWPTPAAAAEAWDVLAAAFPPAPNPDADDEADMFQPFSPQPADFDESAPDAAPQGASAAPLPFLPDSAIPPLARPMPERDAPLPAADAWVLPERHRPAVEQARVDAEDQARRLADKIRVPRLSRPADGDLYAPAPPRREVAGSVGPKFYEVPAAPQSPVVPTPVPVPEENAMPKPLPADDDVIDLPPDGNVAGVVVGRLGLAATPVSVPGLSGSRLCVGRDGAITLVTAAASGLTDLGQIGRSMTWAVENRQLLGMALSQYRLDATADVRLHLLVGHADARADALRPLLGTGRVTVQTYRKLTWGGRIGVLLEAA